MEKWAIFSGTEGVVSYDFDQGILYFQNMADLAMETVPFLVITLAVVCGTWSICFARNRLNTCKVDDHTSKEDCSRLIDKNSPSQDCLSELPDEVASYILPLLSLRDVARMDTLSRNWREVCLGFPYLDLDWWVMSGMPGCRHSEECETYKEAFLKRVGQVLRNYRDHNILSFRLSCCFNNSYAAIDWCISFAAATKYLRSLTLQFACEKGRMECYMHKQLKDVQRISGSFLNQFSYLKDLHLHSCILKIGNDFRLSNLTTLDLCDIILDGTQWKDFLSLSSSTIECLRLRACNVPNRMCIDDNFKRLRSLLIGECYDMEELQLSARNLKTFEIWCLFLQKLKCSFSSVPKLESVHIYLYPYLVRHAEGFFKNLAANVPSLKYLILRGLDNLVPSRPSCQSILFSSVLSVRISMHFNDGNTMKHLPLLLKSFPLLKKLELTLPRFLQSHHHELWVPYRHTHTHLKEVELSNFQVEWIHVATFLLKSAIVLDRILLTKSYRDFVSFESWAWCVTDDRLLNYECEIIHKALVGQASSTTVEMIIEKPD